ncbi:hypothetical protein ABBQ38_011407 [Trebouxia sp. C0009 RCD-2024]
MFRRYLEVEVSGDHRLMWICQQGSISCTRQPYCFPAPQKSIWSNRPCAYTPDSSALAGTSTPSEHKHDFTVNDDSSDFSELVQHTAAAFFLTFHGVSWAFCSRPV